jgi:hypothetical protein
MKDITDILHGAAHGGGVANVTGNELQIEPAKMKARTAGPDQRPHRESFSKKLSSHGGAD